MKNTLNKIKYYLGSIYSLVVFTWILNFSRKDIFIPFKISEGESFSLPRRSPAILFKRRIRFRLTLDEAIRLGDPDNTGITKIMGFSLGMNPHKNSFRLGIRREEKGLRFLKYYYNNKVRGVQDLFLVEYPVQGKDFIIEIFERFSNLGSGRYKEYVITARKDEPGCMTFVKVHSCMRRKGIPFLLQPYFESDETPVCDIPFHIKILKQ